MTDLTYFLIGLFIFTMNAMPGFMPPTWLILAFFYLHFNLDLVPLVVIGASSASLGRVVLANFAKLYIRKYFPASWFKNYDALGAYLSQKQELTAPLVLTYAFFPIPSNQIFIVAGLSRLDLRIIAISFFIGRLISYTFWVSLANAVVDNLELVFTNHLLSTTTILAELAGFLLILLIGKINWQKLLKINQKV